MKNILHKIREYSSPTPVGIISPLASQLSKYAYTAKEKIAHMIATTNFGYCDNIEKYGTAEQKNRFLAPVATGTEEAAFAVYEAQASIDICASR